MSLGPLEIILLLVVIALIFGARKLPDLGKGLGRGIKEFRQEVREPTPPVTDVASRPLEPANPVQPSPAEPRPAQSLTDAERR